MTPSENPTTAHPQTTRVADRPEHTVTIRTDAHGARHMGTAAGQVSIVTAQASTTLWPATAAGCHLTLRSMPVSG